jgi:hypothetical protein
MAALYPAASYLEFYWSTGRELNPRILVLQTSALATSPPVLILLLAWTTFSQQ